MLRILQRSLLKGFRYEAFDGHGTPVGDIVWPPLPQASNARLRWHEPGSPEGDIQIHCVAGDYRIGFEFLSRGFVNDLRFTLHQTGEPLAVADALHRAENGRRRVICLSQPVAAELVRENRWVRASYRLDVAGQTVGRVDEPRWFSWQRELRVDLPAYLGLPVQLFITFLMINAAFR